MYVYWSNKTAVAAILQLISIIFMYITALFDIYFLFILVVISHNYTVILIIKTNMFDYSNIYIYISITGVEFYSVEVETLTIIGVILDFSN